MAISDSRCASEISLSIPRNQCRYRYWQWCCDLSLPRFIIMPLSLATSSICVLSVDFLSSRWFVARASWAISLACDIRLLKSCNPIDCRFVSSSCFFSCPRTAAPIPLDFVTAGGASIRAASGLSWGACCSQTRFLSPLIKHSTQKTSDPFLLIAILARLEVDFDTGPGGFWFRSHDWSWISTLAACFHVAGLLDVNTTRRSG